MTENDTIAAVSTAPGEGGIGIVRISGERASEILGRIFIHGRDGSFHAPVQEIEFTNRTMYYGQIIDPSSSETVDEVLVVYMEGPGSYTGEDVCEIQCHGGGVPLKRILDIVCGLGAAPAQPGEFTKRAFLNGRIDLAQAGAVIDLIRSKTELGYHAAKEQAEGKLSIRVRAVREILLGALAEMTARIDYPEYDGEEKVSDTALNEAAGAISELLEEAEAGRLVKDGVRAAIIGRPNTGKSSLFNSLVREDAAIVTATPGTTRDAIEVWLDVQGIPVLLSDTAGIREKTSGVEELGIERAKEQYRKADVSIFLLDRGEPLSEADFSIAKMLDPEKKHIIVLNKKDLPAGFGREKAVKILPFDFDEKDIIEISLLSDEGCKDASEKIEERLGKLVLGGVNAGSSLLVTKVYHKGLLEKALREIEEAKQILDEGKAPEFAEVNLRAAWNALGEVTGETATEDIINRVFEEFCVGK